MVLLLGCDGLSLLNTVSNSTSTRRWSRFAPYGVKERLLLSGLGETGRMYSEGPERSFWLRQVTVGFVVH